MPARSTAGATFASAAGTSGSGRSNRSGCSVRSGGSTASEIFGTYPSSRRRLAQNAASITASISRGSGSGVATFACLKPHASWHTRETAAFVAIVAAVFAWLLWIARPELLPIGHGPDLTHHLLLVDFIERHWRLPHDPGVEAYLGEFFHYTPGGHVLTSLAGAWFGIGGLRAVYPLLALSVALKTGFVFLIARRVVSLIPVALAAATLSFAAPAYVVGSFTHDFFFAQVMAELFAVAAWWAVAVWDDGAWK